MSIVFFHLMCNTWKGTAETSYHFSFFPFKNGLEHIKLLEFLYLQHTPLKVHRGADDFLPNLSQRCVSGSSRILPTFLEGVYRDGLRRMLFHQRDYTADGRGADGLHRCAGEADTHWGSAPTSRQRIGSAWRSSGYFGAVQLGGMSACVAITEGIARLFLLHSSKLCWCVDLSARTVFSILSEMQSYGRAWEWWVPTLCGGPLLCWVKCHFFLSGCTIAPMTYSQVRQRSHFT